MAPTLLNNLHHNSLVSMLKKSSHSLCLWAAPVTPIFAGPLSRFSTMGASRSGRCRCMHRLCSRQQQAITGTHLAGWHGRHPPFLCRRIQANCGKEFKDLRVAYMLVSIILEKIINFQGQFLNKQANSSNWYPTMNRFCWLMGGEHFYGNMYVNCTLRHFLVMFYRFNNFFKLCISLICNLQ